MNETTQTQATETQDAIILPDAEIEVPEGWKLISDDEMEALTKQLVEDHREDWQIQDLADSAVIAGEELDLIRNEYFYEFQQGGKWIRGLTAKMIGDLATANGISEVIEAREYVEHDDKHEFTIVVEMPDPRNPDRMLKRSGFAEEPKELYGKPDKFAKQKAYTKAFRRACEKLLPQALLIATKLKFARLVPADWTPNPQRKALPAAQNGNRMDSETQNAMNACFDTFKEQEQTLLDLGVSKADFWEALKGVLGVQSREDMTVAQWNAVIRDLNMIDFGDSVRDVLVKCGVNLADLEPEPDRND